MTPKQVAKQVEAFAQARRDSEFRPGHLRTWNRLVARTMPEFAAGFPYMPPGQELSLAKGYPDDTYKEIEEEIANQAADELACIEENAKSRGMKVVVPEPEAESGGWEVINTWVMTGTNSVVFIRKHSVTGERDWGFLDRTRGLLRMTNNYLACSDAWSVRAEGRAVKKLRACLPTWKFKQYILTGLFWEESKKSKMRYLFRRGRPTLVCKPFSMFDPDADDSGVKVICTLCFHPVGYYKGTWAGGLCPTDDIVAALKLMRADEHMFWRKANQHAPNDPMGGFFS